MTEIFKCLDENGIAALAEEKGSDVEARHAAICPKCGEAVARLKEVIATTPKNLPVAPYEALPEELRQKISRKQYAAMIEGYGRRNLMTGETAFPKKLSLSDGDDYLCHCGFMLMKTSEDKNFQWEDDVFPTSHVRFFECSECKSSNCTECPKEWTHDGISGLISLSPEI